MKILLDNCVHYRAKSLFAGHDVYHARDLDWRDLTNGALLQAAAAQLFDVLATTDKNIRHEHNLEKLPIAVLELNTRFTRINDLRLLEPHLEAALRATLAYLFVSVNATGEIEIQGERVQP